jgi:hypothetical protein
MVREVTCLSIGLLLLASCQVSRPSYGQWEKKDGLEAFRIETSSLRGDFVAADHTHAVKGCRHGFRGLVFLPTGRDLHPVEGMLDQTSRRRVDGILNLFRVYSGPRQHGALRGEAAEVRQLADGAELTWPANEGRPVEIQAVWRVTGPAQIDFSLVAVPGESLQDFEILLASYVALDMLKGVHLSGQAGPELFRVRPSAEYGDRENYLFFPLGVDGRRGQQRSGRFKSGSIWKSWKSHVTAADAALPIAFADDGKTQVVLLGEPESVSGICATATPSEPPPEGWNGMELHSALYFSLFCRDVVAGERLMARARLVVIEQPKDSLAAHGKLYEEFLAGRP